MTSRPWLVKHDGRCRICGGDLAPGMPAVWESATRSMRCIDCPTEVAVEGAPAPGIAGASARREYERRRDSRDDRVKDRFGRRLGSVLLAVAGEPGSTRAWATGARGEEKLGEVLAAIDGIVVLHDRRIPGSRANIDHIAIAPAGVFVIDAKRYEGEIRVRDVGGLFRADRRLYVGRRDCSGLVDGMGRQVEAVNAALAGVEGEDDLRSLVVPVLCFVDGSWPLLSPARDFRGVRLEGPRSLARQLRSPGPLTPDRITAVGARLAQRLSG